MTLVMSFLSSEFSKENMNVLGDDNLDLPSRVKIK